MYSNFENKCQNYKIWNECLIVFYNVYFHFFCQILFYYQKILVVLKVQILIFLIHLEGILYYYEDNNQSLS